MTFCFFMTFVFYCIHMNNIFYQNGYSEILLTLSRKEYIFFMAQYKCNLAFKILYCDFYIIDLKQNDNIIPIYVFYF